MLENLRDMDVILVTAKKLSTRIPKRLATYTYMRRNGCRGLRVLVTRANAFVFGLSTRE